MTEYGSKRATTLVSAATIGLVLTVACRADPAPRDGAIAVSTIHPASHCFIDRVLASGVFVARHVVEVRPQRDGLIVSERLAEAGDVVAKDQMLAKLVAAKAPQDVVAAKAPVAGTLVADSAVVGAYAAANSGDPLFRIAENGEVELKAEALATSLPRLRTGMAARLHVVGLGDIDGRIASLDGGIDAQTQLGSLRVSVGADPRLRVGGFALVTIDTGQDCGLTIPLSAVLFGKDGPVVATVQADRIIMRRVTTGVVAGGDIEVHDGLTKDDFVVSRAASFLRDGDHVRPVTPAP